MRFVEDRPLLSYVGLVVAALFIAMGLTIALDLSAATGAMICFGLIGACYVAANELNLRARRQARAELEENKLRRQRNHEAELEQRERKAGNMTGATTAFQPERDDSDGSPM